MRTENPFGLFSNFFQVPIQDLINGYTFAAVRTDPASSTPAARSRPTDGWGTSGNPFEGGTGPGDTMPWDGVDYHLNLLQPFQTLYDSLLQTLATDGVGGTGVEVPSLEGVMHTFENLEAGYIIDFDPYTAGSPACPAACDIPAEFQIPSLVAAIAKADPTNTTLAEWVAQDAINPALVNEPTQDEINASTALLQTGIYNLDADRARGRRQAAWPASTPSCRSCTRTPGTSPIPHTRRTRGTGPLDPEYGGYNPMLVFNDLLALATNNDWNYGPAGQPRIAVVPLRPAHQPRPVQRRKSQTAQPRSQTAHPILDGPEHPAGEPRHHRGLGCAERGARRDLGPDLRRSCDLCAAVSAEHVLTPLANVNRTPSAMPGARLTLNCANAMRHIKGVGKGRIGRS